MKEQPNGSQVDDLDLWGLHQKLRRVLDVHEVEIEDAFFNDTCGHPAQEELLAFRDRLTGFANWFVQSTNQFGSKESKLAAIEFLSLYFRQDDREDKIGLAALVHDVVLLSFS